MRKPPVDERGALSLALRMGREEGRREGREEGEKKGLRLGVLILCEALTATLCNLEALQQSIKSSRRWLS